MSQFSEVLPLSWHTALEGTLAGMQLEMLLIPNALCWSSRKCNCACMLPAEVQLHLRVTRRSCQKLFAGKNFVKILVTTQTQLHSYSEQQTEQRAFGNSNICSWLTWTDWHYKPNAWLFYNDWWATRGGHSIICFVIIKQQSCMGEGTFFMHFCSPWGCEDHV